jgi:hypothetical protein
MTVKWLAQSTIYRDSIDLLAVIDYGSERDIGMPMQLLMTKHERNQAVIEPTLALQPDSAKSLMQALWDAGIRPANWSSPDGEINALRNHVGFAEHVAKTLLARPSQT